MEFIHYVLFYKYIYISINIFCYQYLFINFYLLSLFMTFLSFLFLIFLTFTLLMTVYFFFISGHEEAEMKQYTACLEQEGLQELELAKVCTPASWLMDLVSAGIHKVSGLAPPSPSATSSPVEGQWSPSPSDPTPKKVHHSPTTSVSGAPREEEAPLQEMPLPLGPTEAIAGPSGSSQLPLTLQESLPVPCCIPQLTHPAWSFKSINLKGSSKLYLCKWCKKQTSSWDSMVSHCLQEHIGIHLVCVQCGMSYTDPSTFHLHDRGTITCCSIRLFQFFLSFLTHF